jgi:hypothetical protein
MEIWNSMRYQKIYGISIAIAALLLISIVFSSLTGFLPDMPGAGLDPSWSVSLNQAVAQHLNFGRDIAFTYGPFASVVTHYYSPATDSRMLFGGIYLSISYSIALIYLMGRNLWKLLLGSLAVILGTIVLRDAILLAYPLIFALCTLKITRATEKTKGNFLLFALIAFPLGLIPLTKGSFLISLPITILLCCSLLLWKRKPFQSLATLIIPFISLVIFWTISGQPLLGIIDYFNTMIPIASGYTEAMSLNGRESEVISYIIISIIFISFVFFKNILFSEKIFLTLIFALFLFLSFKAGFVRHDGHAIIAGNSLVIASLLLFSTFPRSKFFVSACITAGGMIVGIIIDNHYVATSPKFIYANIRANYESLWNGIQIRRNDENLRNTFTQTMLALRQASNIPLMSGTSDIYSSDQASLIASGNLWNPRPTFQSYSAYTPSLIKANAAHLLQENAPDNIVFRVEPIDGRLPALEDGASWPIFLKKYHPVSVTGGAVFLKKSDDFTKEIPAMQSLNTASYHMGEVVPVPTANNPIYAEIEIRKTLIGRIENILFKPNELKISLELNNGTHIEYRFISEMAKTGFILSPLINNTAEFNNLYYNKNILKNNYIKSLKINEDGNRIRSWNKQYQISFKELGDFKKYPAPSDLDAISFTPPVVEKTTQCSASIDVLNGGPGNVSALSVDGILSARGWFAINTQTGSMPDAVYVSLTDGTGKPFLFPAQSNGREDVAAYFKQASLANSGFQFSTISLPAEGRYTLGLAYKKGGVIYMCPQPTIPTTILNTPVSHANN